MRMSAVLSADGVYRYELRREWNLAKPPLCAIMLNPSTADAHKNDATITRMIKRASMWGHGSLIVVNVGAGRATAPKVWRAMEDPIGPRNAATVLAALRETRQRGGVVLAGWGNSAPLEYVTKIRKLAWRAKVELLCLGLTADKQPTHPLYVPYAKEAMLWSG